MWYYILVGKSRVRDQLRLHSEKLGIEFELGGLFPSQNLFPFDLTHKEEMKSQMYDKHCEVPCHEMKGDRETYVESCVIGKCLAHISSASTIPLICPGGLAFTCTFRCVSVEPFAVGTSGSSSSLDFSTGLSRLSVVSS